MDLTYTLIFSHRKSLTITVERDRSIVVKAPIGTDPEKIRRIIESRKTWLFEKTRHPQKYKDLPHPPGKELVNGESILYLGKNYRITIEDYDGDIHFNRQLTIPRQLEDPSAALKAWYINKAHEKILPRVHQFARGLGVKFKHAKIGRSKYRWGSCTPEDNVIFNWRLVKAPTFVIDYVIAHELAHLLEANHNDRFWNIVKAQIVEMEKARSWLRENGGLLEQDI